MKKFERMLGMLLFFVLGVCSAKAAVTNPFEWKSGDATTQYRIPAIVRIDATTLVAFSDLRGVNNSTKDGDIGNGHNSIVAKKSTDNGQTWGEQITILDCSQKGENFGYGDAAVVYDKDSKEILLMCCGGTVGYNSSTWSNRLKTYKAVLNPADLKPVEPTEVTDKIYSLFTNSQPGGLFPTSGRMCQSKIIKKGSNYRIYLGLCTTIGAQIIYTDDLGENWNVLGTPGAQLVHNANKGKSDETKCAELPDGNVWISARYNVDGQSRGFNIFSYKDATYTDGSWATPTSGNTEASPKGGGFKMSSSRTNGGIILLPARRVTDKKNVYIAIHTIPYGWPDGSTDSKGNNISGKDRYQLGINWKVLRDRNDFEAMKGDKDSDPDVTYPSSKMLTGWKNYTIPEANSYSAYSSVDDNGTTGIDILYEFLQTSTTENSGKFYNQVYNSISLSTITGGLYEYATDLDREKFMKVNVLPVPGKVYLIKARDTDSKGNVSEYYLHSNFSVSQQGDVTKTEDLGALTAKAHNGDEKPDPTYYWTLSKDGNDGDLYFSSFNGDGYMGWGAKGTNYNTGESGQTVCVTPNYANLFKIYGFLHNAWSDKTDQSELKTGVDGYSMKYDQGKNNRVLVVNHTQTVSGMVGEHEINWSYMTYRDADPNKNNVHWTSDLIFTEVSPSDNTNYGSFNQPEFYKTGFPIKFARSDDNAPFMYDNDDYNYYATVKAPFPIVIPDDVTAYKVKDIAKGQAKDKVTLDKFDLGTDRTLPRETPVLLMTSGTRGQGETTVTKYVTLGNGKPFTEPNATTGINSATGLAGTLGREVIADGAYSDQTGKDNYLYYILAKKNGKVALYRLGKNKNNEWAIGKNKAYFKFPLTSGAKAAPLDLEFSFLTTGIQLLTTKGVTDGKVYDLNGRYMGTTLNGLAKGIYIQNGRKIAK